MLGKKFRDYSSVAYHIMDESSLIPIRPSLNMPQFRSEEIVVEHLIMHMHLRRYA
jgi:hypothetical protein